MNSEKPFYEVFPTYKADNDEVGGLLDDVKVYRITSTANRDIINVYFKSPRPIHRKDIWGLEKSLSRNLFPRAHVKFILHEKYELSGLYTLRTLMDTYGRSISYELKVMSPLLFSIYQSAEKECEGNDTFLLKLQDTVVARKEEEALLLFFDGVFNTRCGMDVHIVIDYIKAERSDEEKAAEIRVQQEIAAISGRAYAAKENIASAPAGGYGSSGNKGNSEKNSGNVQRQRFSQGSGKSGWSGSRGGGHFTKSDDPDVIYRRNFDDQAMEIKDIIGEIGEVTVRGQVIKYEERELRSGDRTLIKFDITDFTDTIGVRIFADNEELETLREGVKQGTFIKVKGVTGMTKYEPDVTIASIIGIKKITDFRKKREDNAPVKRVELHCHTKMSNMDGVADVVDIMKTADRWGWNAIAVTDHGSVQAFPVANHDGLGAISNKDFKVIYGVEGYLVDDLKNVVSSMGYPDTEAVHYLDDTYCVFDIETTGFSPAHNKIIEIGAVIVQQGRVTDRYDEFVNPGIPIPYRIEKLTGINDTMVMKADGIDAVLPRFLKFAENCVMVGHNASFDMSFIKKNADDLQLSFDKVFADTLELSRIMLPDLASHKLDRVAKELGVSLENHHRAVDDAGATAEIWIKLCERLRGQGIDTLDDIGKLGTLTPAAIMKMPTYHVIILAKNDTGRVNLYRLISLSHVKYYSKRPRIPKSELIRYREGLIVGSACEAGELFRAVEDDRPEEEIARIAGFYDYLEIQPVGNNRFLLDEDNDINDEEDLKDLNRKIVELGEQMGKPVCATCDVHFLNPEDEIYRRIIMTGKGFEDADKQAPLYLRTTDEMLEEFQYLGSEKAREVVIKNTNLIADMIEKISPVRPDKCPPVIENSDQTLRDICYKRAHELYGDVLPKQVEERLEVELKSIIGNGYAVMYVIAQKLVWKSNEDGYLVGSRGSVGSSFVAYMAGITEVNSLAPHYLCPKCHYNDFDSDEVKKYAEDGMCGIDMPDRVCPECGEKLLKLGFDIPFETFLGFSGDKEPDIDLNFSSDYQSKAHKYTEVIFGAGHAFRAGTMGTLADKTAYGYVKKYYEEKNEHKRACEIDRIAAGCTGVLRTTGQHPGGIVVLPHGEEINTFTPVQHPADDMTTSTITTHFEYHSIDHNLLKLDILGHDDPTMIRFLQDAADIDPLAIPLDDKKVMSLFQNTSALGITPDDIDGCTNGALGLPEFGTHFVINMLMDAKPTSFSDLIRISGLSHGTDVWIGNADELIKSGKATLGTAICCRDDIMIYLINKGMDPALSFKTMESVRKGKGLKDEMTEAMQAAGVPDWYIDSCRKIKYMFPKAHAAAYVMMAWRVAWCKVYKPLAYYCAFFSIRAKAFSFENCCQGAAKLNALIKDYDRRENELSDTEAAELHDMHIVQEMYARGFEFTPIDLTKVSARYFTIVDGKIMPALSSISSIGEKAADALIENIVEEAEKGPFLSKDDFCIRSGASRAMADKLSELGILGDIPESNQLSLFDI